MKRLTDFKTLLLAAGIASLTLACKPEEEVKPVFPSTKITATVAAGESYTIALEPNLDWTVSIEGDGAGNYFWIDDNGMKENSISGAAGKVVFDICFSETEELDVNRVCTVMLTMKGESHAVAELTRLALGRSFSVYAASAEEWGFKVDNGAYVYGADPVSAAELVGFSGSIIYSLPIKVISNYDWTVALPEWLKIVSPTTSIRDESNGGKAGVTELLLEANLSESNANGATEAVRFLDASNSEIAVEFNVTLPAFADRREVVCNSELEFNQQGQLHMPAGSYADVPAVIYVLAAKGFVIRALEYKGEWHDTRYADWVHSSISESEGYFNWFNAEITVDGNGSETRMADIFVFPASLANLDATAICDENSPECAFKEEYAKYCIGRLVQEGESAAYITLSDNEDETYKATLEPETTWLASQFDAGQAYTLTYSDKFSSAVLLFSEPFARYEVYDYDINLVAEDAQEDFWLTFNPFMSNSRANVCMDPSLFSNAGAEKPESFVVVYDENDVALAAIQCIYDENASGGNEGGNLVCNSGNAEVRLMDPSNEYYEMFQGAFTVEKEIYELSTSATKVNLDYASRYSNFLLYDMSGEKLENGTGITIEANTANNFDVFVGDDVTEASKWIIVIQDENRINMAVILFCYNPEGGAELPFSFAYPTMVSGAKLSACPDAYVKEVLGQGLGLKAENIALLTYTVAEPQMAMINCPGEPFGGAAWNNWDDATQGPSEDYWLTYEMQSNTQILVFMSKAGEVDYFIFVDGSGNPVSALVCTSTAE